MASLQKVVSEYKDELREGIAWVAFWKEGRSWKAECFWLDPADDRLSVEDKSRLKEISSIDPGAVILNGYYCGYLAEDMSVKDLSSGVRHHYENNYNDIHAFIENHEPGEFQEKLEEARKAVHSMGMPFAGKYDEDFDPYVYNGKMSLEDVDLMHRLMQEGG